MALVHVRLLVILGFLASWSAFADSWGPPTPIVVSSPDTKIIVRIEPGGTSKAIGKFAQLTKYESARAAFFRYEDSPEKYSPYQKIDLSNPIKPIAAYISNEGVLATLDNYGNPGHGDIVSIYDSQGDLLRTYTIDEIYTENAIEEMPRTVSSRAWRHPEYPSSFSGGGFSGRRYFWQFSFFQRSGRLPIG